VTGSSVFDLQNKLGEPLVGRQNTIQLFPIAQAELSGIENFVTTKSKLEERLIYGSYPELFHLESYQEKANYLEELVSSYLLKDILSFNGIKKSDKLVKLLQLLALQIGNQLSIDELASNLQGISRNTVESYLDLLEKVFVIYKVSGFSRNLRKEVVKSNKWYFYDNGVRNALINNFNSLTLRMDTGMLWENYIMAERRKHNSYIEKRVNYYFWRTYDQQEIDLIEEKDGQLSAFEFKWNQNKKPKVPAAWSGAYPEATFEVISSDNYLEFVG
jgi:predicted AAA+ superfamily ATPase